jgi:hypothetical protein
MYKVSIDLCDSIYWKKELDRQRKSKEPTKIVLMTCSILFISCLLGFVL